MNTNQKGNKGEREVADLFAGAGFAVRGLESAGDWLAVSQLGRTLHIEVKRHERVRVPEWLRQLEADCPAGLDWLLAFRQNRSTWYGVQPLDVIAAREARIAQLEQQLADAGVTA